MMISKNSLGKCIFDKVNMCSLFKLMFHNQKKYLDTYYLYVYVLFKFCFSANNAVQNRQNYNSTSHSEDKWIFGCCTRVIQISFNGNVLGIPQKQQTRYIKDFLSRYQKQTVFNDVQYL